MGHRQRKQNKGAKKTISYTKGSLKQLKGLPEGTSFIWLDVATGSASKPFGRKELETHVTAEHLTSAKAKGWALIEYRVINDMEVNLSDYLALKELK